MTTPDRPPERHVGGLWCREVMAHLPDFVAGAIAPEDRERVRTHLEGCDWCARFGGRYATVVATLQDHLAEPEPVPDGVLDRLDAALADLETR